VIFLVSNSFKGMEFPPAKLMDYFMQVGKKTSAAGLSRILRDAYESTTCQFLVGRAPLPDQFYFLETSLKFQSLLSQNKSELSPCEIFHYIILIKKRLSTLFTKKEIDFYLSILI